MLQITGDFTGGNIAVVEIREHEVILENELRDTEGDWFYWAFCAEGGQGQTVTFRFSQKNRVGYFGAAVSADLKNWRWTGGADGESFTYTFGPEESKLYFAHHMLYHPQRFFDFAESHLIKPKVLCVSRRKREVPCITIGSGGKTIILTARHHCCESTGNYVLEGVLSELLEQPIPGYTVFCVPFVDYDGVLDGDQGKNRRPHDHNRDYGRDVAAIYPEVEAIRTYAEQNNPVFAFDFHSPWHLGDRNDRCFFVQNNLRMRPRYNRFGALWERCITEQAFVYRSENDMPPDTQWNSSKSPNYSGFMAARPGCEMACSVETAYFGTADNRFSQDRGVETGRCFARALREYIHTEISN